MTKLNEKPTREPSAHIKSLELDPKRKVLFVEGKADRLFLEFLSDGEIGTDSNIIEIESVDFHERIEGGNRGKIIYFASLVSEEEERIKFLADRDYGKYTGEEIPANVILTDFKDLESYLIEEKFLDKFLKIGLKTEKIRAKQLLNEINKAKYFGFIRITSLEKNMNLSINTTNERLSKYLSVDKTFTLSINEDKYLEILLQNPAFAINKKDLVSNINEISKKYSKEEKRDIIHGKDALSVIQYICIKIGFKAENIESVFWMGFDSSKINNYPNLKKAVDYLKN